MTDSKIPPHVDAFWKRFLASRSDPVEANALFIESYRIGATDEDAEEGAQLILSGEKTATSELVWEREISGNPPLEVGSLSVLEDGNSQPVCVMETVWLEVIPFSEVDAVFAHDYGEWGKTLEGWRAGNWEYYAEVCKEQCREMTQDAPLVCERFRVIFR